MHNYKVNSSSDPYPTPVWLDAMADDELDNKPVSDAEFAEFMRPASDTHEIPIEEVKWRLVLTEEEADALLDYEKRNGICE